MIRYIIIYLKWIFGPSPIERRRKSQGNWDATHSSTPWDGDRR